MAGPSAAEQVRAVSDAMLGFGAEQVLIDGAIDRRAASSPAVADGLIISTGAVLGEEIEEVVLQTVDAVARHVNGQLAVLDRGLAFIERDAIAVDDNATEHGAIDRNGRGVMEATR